MGIQTALDSINQNSGSPFGFKNRIINGGMVIDQRNSGTLVSAANGYITDRWSVAKYSEGSGVYSSQQIADAPTGFSNSLKVTVTTAEAAQPTNAYWQIFQKIEGYNVADLGFGTTNPQPFTVSFWVKSSVAGTYSFTIFNDGFNSIVRNYVTTYTINQTNTWEYKSITITPDNTAGAGAWSTTTGQGCCVFFDIGSGSSQESTANTWTSNNARRITGTVRLMATVNATWQITGVQLEKGKQATSFDYRPYGTELALCQRYFCIWRGDATNPALVNCALWTSTSAYSALQFPVTMRTTPTGAYSALTDFNTYSSSTVKQPSAIAIYPNNGTGGYTVAEVNFAYGSAFTSGYAGWHRLLGANAYISFSAEL